MKSDHITVDILEGNGISVLDNGRGIPTGMHEKEKYYWNQRTFRPLSEGLGSLPPRNHNLPVLRGPQAEDGFANLIGFKRVIHSSFWIYIQLQSRLLP